MTATKDQVAQIIVGEAKARNHIRDECLAELSGLYQESGWDETIWDPTHTTYGVAQQDGSYPNRFQGAAAQVKAFFDKLDIKRASPGHGDIWLNICWLQQAPNWPSAQYWWDHGRQAYLTEIKSRITTVTPYLDKYWPTTGGTPVSTPTSAQDPRLTALQAARPDFNEFANWCPNNESRDGTTIDALLVHTQEGAENDDNAALDLSNFCIASADTNNPVSYHRAVRQASDGGVTVVNMVDLSVACWAVGNSNLRSINSCFAGSDAAWTRTQWLTQSKAIDVMAYLTVRDAITVGMDPTRITFGAPNGTGYNLDPPVVSDHRYCTDYLKDGNTHVDVGDNFPADLYKASILKYWAAANQEAPTPAPPPVVTPPVVTPPADDPLVQFNQWVAGATDRQLLEYITRQIGPGDPAWESKDKTLRDKVFGV